MAHAGSEDGCSTSSVDEEVIEINGDQFGGAEKSDAALLNLNYIDLWMLGLTTAIGSHYFSWSSGLSAGFGSYIIALALISSGYFCLVMCISELSSALPFAGGAYGIARVTLGIFPGFLIACYDSAKSILCVASAAYSVGRIITSVNDGDLKLEFLYWFLFYVYVLAINGRGGVFFWRVSKITSIISLLLLLIFVLGSVQDADFLVNAPLPQQEGTGKWFHGGLHHFLRILPTTTRFFVGIQSIDLSCGQIKNPKTEVPKGSVGAVTTVMFTSFAVVCIAVSLPPGIHALTQQLNPFTIGYAAIFNITTQKALALSLPATITYGLGYTYFYGKQLSAMGRSGLLPFVIGNEIAGRNTPVGAHVLGAVIGYGVCVALYYVEAVHMELNNVVILVAMATYISIFLSFIYFRNCFTTVKREFVSPLGQAGAVYGLVIFLLCFVCVAGFQTTQYAIETFVVLTVVLSVYYFTVVQFRQVFSEEEKKVMFQAYLLKNNRAKSRRIKKRGTVGNPKRIGSYSPTPSNEHLNSKMNNSSSSNNNNNSSSNSLSVSASFMRPAQVHPASQRRHSGEGVDIRSFRQKPSSAATMIAEYNRVEEGNNRVEGQYNLDDSELTPNTANTLLLEKKERNEMLVEMLDIESGGVCQDNDDEIPVEHGVSI